MRPGATASVWVTVDVPRDAKPGVYDGRVTLRAEGEAGGEQEEEGGFHGHGGKFRERHPARSGSRAQWWCCWP